MIMTTMADESSERMKRGFVLKSAHNNYGQSRNHYQARNLGNSVNRSYALPLINADSSSIFGTF